MASKTYYHNSLSGFYGKSGVYGQSSWYWGKTSSGGGYTGYGTVNGANQQAISVFYIPIPSDLKNVKATITSIKYTIQLIPTNSSFTRKQLRSYATLSTPANGDYPKNWMSSGGAQLGGGTVTALTPTSTTQWTNVTFDFSTLNTSFNLPAATTSGIYIYLSSDWAVGSLSQWNLSAAARFQVTFNYATQAGNTYAPKNLQWKAKGSGLCSSSQEIQGYCTTAGYWFGGGTSTGKYYLKSGTTKVPANTTTTITFDKVSSPSSRYLTRYVSVSSSNNSPLVDPKNYSSVNIPSYACTCYNYGNNTTQLTYLSSLNSSKLGSPEKSGYTFMGYQTSATTYTSVTYTGSTNWSSSIDSKILYAVYKINSSNKSIALCNCSSSTWQTAWSNTTAKYCYGKGSTTGGITTNDGYMAGDSGYTPTQSGYAFLGWTNKSNEYSKIYNTPLEALGTDSRLYAIFFKNASESMSLALGSNGGPSLSYSTVTRSHTAYKYGTGQTTSSSYTYSSGGNYIPSGNSSYKWSGWCRNSDGSGTKYSTPKAAFEDGYAYITLYAIFEPAEFKITFSPGNYGRGNSKELTTTNGKLTTLPANYFTRSAGTTYYFNYYLQGGTMSTPPGFSVDTSATYGPHYQTSNKTTYYHNYWNTDPNGSPKNNMGVDCWSCGATYSFTSDMTIYPEWGSSVPKYTLPTPTKVGYKFVAWNTNASGTGTNYAAGTEFALRSNKTFYAIWEPEWTIKINNGTTWGDYHVWIYTGATSNNGWQQAIPYVYDGSNWKLTKI